MEEPLLKQPKISSVTTTLMQKSLDSYILVCFHSAYKMFTQFVCSRLLFTLLHTNCA